MGEPMVASLLFLGPECLGFPEVGDLESVRNGRVDHGVMEPVRTHDACGHGERVGIVGVLGPDHVSGSEPDVGDDVTQQVRVADQGTARV